MKVKFQQARIGGFFFLLCGLHLLIVAKLFFLQIVYYSFFVSLGNRQYIVSMTRTPDRGLILDRNNVPLALNHVYMSAFIIPRMVEDHGKVICFLKEHFPLAVSRYEANRQASFMYIQRRLTKEQRCLIEGLSNSDICIMQESSRFYPLSCASTVIGITNIDNEGISGVELSHNAQLRGKPSKFSLKKDARNERHFYFERNFAECGHEGTSLITTIDSTVQFIAHEELLKTVKEFSAVEGSVIIMDPQTGEIYAIANYPTFDPNNTKNVLVQNMKNRAVTEAYEFGSVIKIFLALAALAEGVVTPDTLIDCYNAKNITLQGMRLTTVKPHGLLTFSEVIQGSNNIGTAQIALLINRSIYTHYRRCGFGVSTGTFSGEQAGYITHPSTWTQQSLASLSYGYEIRATLLQLACAMCMVANRGIPVNPHFILLENSTHTGSVQPLYSADIIDTLRTILEQTVHKGTAQRAQIKGYRVLGKTGSANLIVDGVYNPDHTIYTFVGIIEKDSYQRVIATFVKESSMSTYASMVTAPLFERIAERMLIHDGQITAHIQTPSTE